MLLRDSHLVEGVIRNKQINQKSISAHHVLKGGNMSERRVLTSEEKKKLAGYLKFSPDTTFELTPAMYMAHKTKWDETTGEAVELPEFEVDSAYHEFLPSFTLRSMTKSEYDTAQKMIQEEREDKAGKRTLELAIKTREFVRGFVMGWKNLFIFDTTGEKEILFKADPSGGADKDLWNNQNAVPDFHYLNIRNQVYRMSGISQGERLSLKSLPS
jgi:hypothetical protein